MTVNMAAECPANHVAVIEALADSVRVMEKSYLPATGRQVLTTTTGELLQPVRLHYDLFDKNEMMRIFNKLGCIDFDLARRRWAWVYARESSSLKFKRSYNEL